MKFPSFIIFFILTFHLGKGQDALKINEARYALEQAKDCQTAVITLKEVSASGRHSLLYGLYAAKAYECINEKDSALKYYQLFLEFEPTDSFAISKIAELSYQIRSKNNCIKCHGAGFYYVEKVCNNCTKCYYCNNTGKCAKCDGTGCMKMKDGRYACSYNCSDCDNRHIILRSDEGSYNRRWNRTSDRDGEFKSDGKCQYCHGFVCQYCHGSLTLQVKTLCKH